MVVRADGLPPLLLVGDLTYEVERLLRDQMPGIADQAQLRSSYARVRALKKQLPGWLILPSHDPATGESLKVRNAKEA